MAILAQAWAATDAIAAATPDKFGFDVKVGLGFLGETRRPAVGIAGAPHVIDKDFGRRRKFIAGRVK